MKERPTASEKEQLHVLEFVCQGVYSDERRTRRQFELVGA